MLDHEKKAALAARKQRLVTEGQLYRVSIEHAKVNAAYAMRPEALLHGIVDHALGLAGGRMGRFGALLSPGGFSLRSALPFLLTAGSFIARRKLIKPVLSLGVAAALAAAWYRHRGKVLQDR
jgi:hypothetical protein